jgi:hypothetical protein
VAKVVTIPTADPTPQPTTSPSTSPISQPVLETPQPVQQISRPSEQPVETSTGIQVGTTAPINLPVSIDLPSSTSTSDDGPSTSGSQAVSVPVVQHRPARYVFKATSSTETYGTEVPDFEVAGPSDQTPQSTIIEIATSNEKPSQPARSAVLRMTNVSPQLIGGVVAAGVATTLAVLRIRLRRTASVKKPARSPRSKVRRLVRIS